jgi:hypothetical protein
VVEDTGENRHLSQQRVLELGTLVNQVLGSIINIFSCYFKEKQLFSCTKDFLFYGFVPLIPQHKKSAHLPPQKNFFF